MLALETRLTKRAYDGVIVFCEQGMGESLWYCEAAGVCASRKGWWFYVGEDGTIKKGEHPPIMKMKPLNLKWSVSQAFLSYVQNNLETENELKEVQTCQLLSTLLHRVSAAKQLSNLLERLYGREVNL